MAVSAIALFLNKDFMKTRKVAVHLNANRNRWTACVARNASLQRKKVEWFVQITGNEQTQDLASHSKQSIYFVRCIKFSKLLKNISPIWKEICGFVSAWWCTQYFFKYFGIFFNSARNAFAIYGAISQYFLWIDCLLACVQDSGILKKFSLKTKDV